MVYRLASPNIQFSDANGVPLAGGKLFFYSSGTSALQATFQDSALTISNPNPIILDSSGYAGNIFLSQGINYRVVLQDVNGVQQWSIDPVSDPTSSGQTVTPFLAINGAAGVLRSLFFQTAGSNRWSLQANATPESGSNAGTDLVFNAYDDTGAILSSPFTFTRSTGKVKFTKAIGVNKTATSTFDIDATNGINTDASYSASGKPMPNLYVGYANTLVVTNGATPNTQVLVTANSALIPNATAGGFFRSTISVTNSTGSTGSNGLDAGTVAANTWYHVYLIDNGTTTAGLLSTSATAPTLPTGYTASFLVGAAKTDGSSNLYRFLQAGSLWRWQVIAATNTAALPIPISGISGSITVPTWTSVTVRAATGLNPLAVAPPIATRIGLVLGANNSTTMAAPNNAYGAYTSTTNPPPIVINTAGVANVPGEFLLESNAVFYASNGAATLLATTGFTLPVNAD